MPGFITDMPTNSPAYFGTLAQWRKLTTVARCEPYTETRYAGQPHECLAVCVDGLLITVASQLWSLSDYYVSARVSGNFVELMRRTPKPAKTQTTTPASLPAPAGKI